MTVTPEEVEHFEDRLRAHLRQRMTRRRLNAEAVGLLLGVDRSYVSRWLRKGRGQTSQGGISVRIVYRMIREFGIDLETLFYTDPPREFWRSYLPQGFTPDPDAASPTSPQPTRQAAVGEGDGLANRGKKAR